MVPELQHGPRPVCRAQMSTSICDGRSKPFRDLRRNGDGLEAIYGGMGDMARSFLFLPGKMGFA